MLDTHTRIAIRHMLSCTYHVHCTYAVLHQQLRQLVQCTRGHSRLDYAKTMHMHCQHSSPAACQLQRSRSKRSPCLSDPLAILSAAMLGQVQSEVWPQVSHSLPMEGPRCWCRTGGSRWRHTRDIHDAVCHQVTQCAAEPLTHQPVV
jgi:hypothetical protein